MSRRRADVILTERGFFDSRERAKAAILAGDVCVNGQPLRKAGEQIESDAEIRVAATPAYVSRGGTKIEGAFATFGIPVDGLSAVDVGASTGGFTDFLLQHGARSVAAVDVGYGQLAWQLRGDPRVTVFERTNIRHALPDDLGAPFDLAVVDVSFISLRTALPGIVPLLGSPGNLVALVKPQFEAGKGRVGKKGVVRDPAVHADVLEQALAAVRAAGLVVRGLTWSPITGPEGNIEFWLWASDAGEDVEPDVSAVVASAHEALGV